MGDPTVLIPGAELESDVTTVTEMMLAIVSKNDHSVCMFENQTLDMQEIRSVLTDAGHTAVGFATMAAKKANDVRLDFNNRYVGSPVDFRKQALVLVQRAESVRVDVEARVEPVVAKVVDRLPAPAQKLINDATDAAKELQSKSYDFVVKALTVETAAPTAKTPVRKTAAKTTPAARKAAAKPAARKTAAKTAPAARKAAAKPAAKQTAAA